MKDIVIIGAGDFGKEIAWLIEDINIRNKVYNILGYIDDNKELIGKDLNGYRVLGNVEYLNKIAMAKKLGGVISVQNSSVKSDLASKIGNVEWTTLIHPSAIIARTVAIGNGSIIAAGNIISNNTFIGNHCLINLSCTVGHDNRIEDYVSIMPGCNLSGFTTLKEGCFLGTGVKVIPHKTINANSVIGAGAVVLKDIPANCTAVGVPARPILINEESLQT